MNLDDLEKKELLSDRLILIPFTLKFCVNISNNDFSDLKTLNLIRGVNWPDDEVVETLPKIIRNLSKVDYPTGFESWMIVKRDTREIIGDVGFKGFNFVEKSCDIGYGIVKEERKKGYAEEASRMLIEWAFSNDFLDKITACCLIDNIDSVNLLKKLNFIEYSRDKTTIYWSLDKS